MRLLYALTALAFLALLGFACAPAHADGWADKLSATIIGAADGPFLGAAISYQAHEHLWTDLGAKRDAGETIPFAGLSTDLQLVADLIGNVLSIDALEVPARARAGGGIDLRNGGAFGYVGYGVDF